jgi:hypothetical protein
MEGCRRAAKMGEMPLRGVDRIWDMGLRIEEELQRIVRSPNGQAFKPESGSNE